MSTQNQLDRTTERLDQLIAPTPEAARAARVAECAISIGDDVRVLRMQVPWSHDDLAQKSGVLRETIQILERGLARNVRLTDVIAVLDALGRQLSVSATRSGGSEI